MTDDVALFGCLRQKPMFVYTWMQPYVAKLNQIASSHENEINIFFTTAAAGTTKLVYRPKSVPGPPLLLLKSIETRARPTIKRSGLPILSQEVRKTTGQHTYHIFIANIFLTRTGGLMQQWKAQTSLSSVKRSNAAGDW